MSKTSATAVVQVLVEIDLGQRWGEDCSVGQVQSQASRETSEAIQRLFAEAATAPKMRALRVQSVRVSLNVE